MKKSLFLLLFLAVALRSFAQPSITNLSFPSSIRDLVNHIINNTFGDAVFRIILSNNNNSENKLYLHHKP